MIDRLERVVRLALRAGADSAEAFSIRSTGTSFAVEKNSITNAHTASHSATALRVIKGGQLGFAHFTDEARARDAVTRALRASRLSPKKGYSFPGRSSAPRVLSVDSEIASMEPRDGVEALARLTDAALAVDRHVVVAGAGVGWGREVTGLVNSEGARFSEEASSLHASSYAVYRNGQSSTGFDFDTKMRGRIDWERVGRDAAELAVKASRPKRLDGKPKEVILTPFAAETLLEFLLVKALYADVVDKGQSVYSGFMGEAVAAGGLTVFDDPLDPSMPNSASHDDEGVRSKKNVLIDGGRLVGVLADSETAAKRGSESRGSSLRFEKRDAERSVRAPPATSGRNIVVKGGNVSFDRLVSSTRDGILVYDALGAHTANPQSGDFSVNSATLFRIKGGRIVHAVKPVMLSGNLPALLKSVTGLGNDYRNMSGSFSPVNLHIPSIRVAGVRVAGR